MRCEHRSDRIRGSVSCASERHRRGSGEPPDDDRGQEVLRSAEAYRADRPHRRPSQYGCLLRSLEALSDEDKKIFSEVAQEAAARATAEIQAKEKELVDFFKQKGLTVSEVNKDDFKENVLKNVSFETFGYRKADFDRIQAIKSEPAF